MSFVIDAIAPARVAPCQFNPTASVGTRVEANRPQPNIPRNATIVPVTGARIQSGSIVIRGDQAFLPNIAASPEGPQRFNNSTMAFVNVIDGIGGLLLGTLAARPAAAPHDPAVEVHGHGEQLLVGRTGGARHLVDRLQADVTLRPFLEPRLRRLRRSLGLVEDGEEWLEEPDEHLFGPIVSL